MSGDPPAQQMTAPTRPASPAPLELTPAAVKRVRRLLVLFSILFALWIAAMIAMYATTVYPVRHPASGSARNSSK
jgi:hypothetical protein